jgi:hypothetical protein
MTTLAVRAFATLPAATLQQVDAEAAFQKRIDRKYVVTPRAVDDVVEACGESLRILDISGERSFGYRSTYFDTPNLMAYRAAATGRRPRFKVRTRRYLATGTSWLEVKRRDRHGGTDKHRMGLGSEVGSESEFESEAIAFLSGFDEVRPHVCQLRPSLITTYERTTLLSTLASTPNADQRVTIDRDVECRSIHGGDITSLGQHLVVETKSPLDRPGPFDRALWRAGVRPVRISKYAIGIAGAHPELPANRWNRVLRRYVQATPTRSTLDPEETPT